MKSRNHIFQNNTKVQGDLTVNAFGESEASSEVSSEHCDKKTCLKGKEKKTLAAMKHQFERKIKKNMFLS